MAETFSVISPPDNAATPVTPGAGSSGFSSGAVAYASSDGVLTGTTNLVVLNGTAASSAALWIQSSHSAQLSSLSGGLVIGPPGAQSMGIGTTGLQVRAASGVAAGMISLNPQGGEVVLGGTTGGRVRIPSTLSLSTSVGTTGAAAAPPASPEVYLKFTVPNAAHALTTLYIPAYLST